MYKINLIKGWRKTETYRNYRNILVIMLTSLSLLLIIIYLFFFVRFLMVQRKLANISNQQFLSQNTQVYSTETITRTIYSLRKLEQIRKVYLDYPDYYLYHQFLLTKIFKFGSFRLESYALTKGHEVSVSLVSKKLDHIFSLINLLESPQYSKYFSDFEIKSIDQTVDKTDNLVYFKIDFLLQFNDKLGHEKS